MVTQEEEQREGVMKEVDEEEERGKRDERSGGKET